MIDLQDLKLEKRDERDLIPVVVQDRVTGEIRMLAWATSDAVRATLASKRATFFSRSRDELWEKGKTSGHHLDVERVLVDCDADALIYLATPHGPTCHTGAPSCFFETLEDASADTRTPRDSISNSGTTLLARLDATLAHRKKDDATKSYAKSLYDGGPAKIGAKLREEADELARAVESEEPARVIGEAADVLFHLMVALRSRDVGIADVLQELERRSGTSGHDEKRSRAAAAIAGQNTKTPTGGA